jgi:peptidoglycan/xylan/chitin deacetylase (PgdA/CDA1 family)
MSVHPFRPEHRSPAGWPDGRGLAVYVAIGIEAYREGRGQTEDILPGVPAPDHVNAAWREYGNRVGALRLIETLVQLAIPPTVLLNTLVYDAAPRVIDAARMAGAELVAHGISNSDSLSGMNAVEEAAYLAAAAARIEDEEGRRPGGWSSPWLAHTEHTIDLLPGAGYRYLLDLRFDDQPVWLASKSGPLLAIPYALELNDSSSVIGRQLPAGAFADAIIDEFEELRATAGDRPTVMSVVLHSFISGVPFRLRQVRRALERIAAHAETVWLTQPSMIFDAYARIAPPSSDPGESPAFLSAAPARGGADHA